MAFLHTRSQERSKSKQSDIDLEEKEDERPSVDDRPDYQLLFMSSWLLGDYWTFVWKTFGLDGPKAWEGRSSHTRDCTIRSLESYFPKVITATSTPLHLFMQFPSCPSCYGLVAVARFVIFSFFHRFGTIYHDIVLANISSYFQALYCQ